MASTMSDTVATSAMDINQLLDESNDYLFTETALQFLAVLLAVVVCALAIMAVPLRRKGQLDGAWTQIEATGLRPHVDYANTVANYEEHARDTNYILPAAVLRETVDGRLGTAIGHLDPIDHIQEAKLIARVGDICGAEAAKALQVVYKRLKQLPSRPQAATAWSTGHMSQRDFDRLRHDVDQLYQALDKAADKS